MADNYRQGVYRCMRIRETDIDERLELLEHIEDGEVFLFDTETARIPFQNRMVSKILLNREISHAVLIFVQGVPRPRAQGVAEKIGKTVEAFNRAVEIDIFFEVPRELFDIIRAECGE